jgi:oxaloacetate decarboxylase (Na+ extruding) subunit gamma
MATIWSDTLLLMVLGMGTVFIFLLFLILAVNIMSAVIQRLAPEDVPSESSSLNDIAAVAAAAYHRHRNSQPK